MTHIPPATRRNNRRVLATSLRAKATRLDRIAWQLEAQPALQTNRGVKTSIRAQRSLADSLRRTADDLSPKRTRRGEPKRIASIIHHPASLS